MCAEVLVWILQRQKIRIVCQCWLWTMNIIVNISHLKMLCKISDYNTTSMWLGRKYAGVKKTQRILCLTNTMNHVFEEEENTKIHVLWENTSFHVTIVINVEGGMHTLKPCEIYPIYVFLHPYVLTGSCRPGLIGKKSSCGDWWR